MLQTFKTKSSVWTFNDESMTFLRTPHEDGKLDHPTLTYQNVAQSFISAEAWVSGGVWVQLSQLPYDYIISGALLEGESFTGIPAKAAQ